MRPEILNKLFAESTTLPGIGERLGKLVTKLAGPHVVDLLWHLPYGVIDRRYTPAIAEARPGSVATLTVTVREHEAPRTPRRPYRVWCDDETGTISLVFFHAHVQWLQGLLPIGLATDCRLVADVPRDRPIRSADVEVPAGRLSDELHAEQRRRLPRRSRHGVAQGS